MKVKRIIKALRALPLTDFEKVFDEIHEIAELNCIVCSAHNCVNCAQFGSCKNNCPCVFCSLKEVLKK